MIVDKLTIEVDPRICKAWVSLGGIIENTVKIFSGAIWTDIYHPDCFCCYGLLG